MVFTAELKGAFYHRMFILLFLLLLLDLVVGLFFKLIFIYIDIYIDINAKLLQRINVNIWKNSYSVINCFQNIKNKNNKSYFITFDICNFYPSITEDFLCKALSSASHFTNIPTEHEGIILHSKKSILMSNGEQ